MPYIFESLLADIAVSNTSLSTQLCCLKQAMYVTQMAKVNPSRAPDALQQQLG